MHILLTGSTGVIGRRVMPLLVVAGHRVTAVTRSAAKAAEVERLGATPATVDLSDASHVRRAVSGHDAVINLATHIPPPQRAFFPGAWRENNRVRREVSAMLADAVIAQGGGRFIQESFAPVYPDCGTEWIDETMALRPARYNRGVVDAEAAAARARGVVLRFGFFYGPDSGFTAGLLESVRGGRAQMLGRPEAYWSSVSHDDAARAVVAALAASPGVYNVVDDEPVTRREYVDSLARALGVRAPKLLPYWLRYVLGSLGETLSRSQRISNRKFRAASGWAPGARSVREGWVEVVGRWVNERSTLAPGV